jgi:hypothetical protein
MFRNIIAAMALAFSVNGCANATVVQDDYVYIGSTSDFVTLNTSNHFADEVNDLMCPAGATCEPLMISADLEGYNVDFVMNGAYGIVTCTEFDNDNECVKVMYQITGPFLEDDWDLLGIGIKAGQEHYYFLLDPYGGLGDNFNEVFITGDFSILECEECEPKAISHIDLFGITGYGVSVAETPVAILTAFGLLGLLGWRRYHS